MRIKFVMNVRQLALRLIAGLFTFLIVYLMVTFVYLKDFSTSLEPGWHTTIYPPGWHAMSYPFGNSFTLTFAIFISTAFVYLLFKYLFRFLTFIWLKIFSLHPDGKRTN